MKDYEIRRYLLTERPDKINTRIRDFATVSDGVVSNFSIEESKGEKPSLNLTYTLESRKLARKSGTRLFVPVNTFRKGITKFAAQKRVSPYVIDHELKADSIVIRIPEGYVVESLPKSMKIESPCLDFDSKIEKKGDCINVCQRILFKAGTYTVEQMPDFETDYNKMVAALNATIVLKKTAN